MQTETATHRILLEAIKQNTQEFRSKKIQPKAFYDSLRARNLNTHQLLLAGIWFCDQNTFSGTFIDQQRCVLEVYFERNLTGNGLLIDDITKDLGQLDPNHQKADLTNPVTMALYYFDKIERIKAIKSMDSSAQVPMQIANQLN